MMRILYSAACIGLMGTAVPAVAQSAADGKAAFAQCAVCHGTQAGEKKMGPTLAGVVGRKAGSVAGFSYSSALVKSGKTWTASELNMFLAAPMKVVPGTRMVVSVADPRRRADLVAYLATLK